MPATNPVVADWARLPGGRVMPSTLYEELGGVGAIAAVVDIFYDRVLADPQLATFFRGIDEQRLRRHQTMFLTMATGGPVTGPSFDLVAAHRHLGIGDEAFDRVAGHLVAALQIAGVEQPLIDKLMGVVGSLRPQIVSAKDAAGVGDTA